MQVRSIVHVRLLTQVEEGDRAIFLAGDLVDEDPLEAELAAERGQGKLFSSRGRSESYTEWAPGQASHTADGACFAGDPHMPCTCCALSACLPDYL